MAREPPITTRLRSQEQVSGSFEQSVSFRRLNPSENIGTLNYMEAQETLVLEINETAGSATPSVPARPRIFVFGLGILLSAFLLFQLELIVAKHTLPWFGGSPAVWTTCMLFFQGALLAGYAFAHWTSGRLSPRAQGKLQLSVIALGLAALFLIRRGGDRADRDPGRAAKAVRGLDGVRRRGRDPGHRDPADGGDR